MSVSDKNNVASNKDAFQIMPATQNYLFDKSINSYPEGNNPNLVLHMNYITRIFSPDAIENDSSARRSLRQYVKLAKKLGTKDILIHAPYTSSEWASLPLGMKVMYDEIIKEGMKLHLEMPAWSSEFISKFTNGEETREYLLRYFTEIFKYFSSFPKGSYYIVPDTAHMFANGCELIEDYEFIFNKFKDFIKYIHLNGNVNYMFKSDKHCPMYNPDNKIKCWKELSMLCSEMNVICIAEVTKIYGTREGWEQYAKEFGFKLVPDNDKYSC